MASREPKRQSTFLGPSKYYNPITSRAWLKHNARVMFLQAVENKTPEVLNALHHDVWPLYESVYWRASPLPSEDAWLYSIHPSIVADWFSGRPHANRTPHSGRALNRLKKALFAWASGYNISAEWTMMYALDAMMFWAAYQSHPDRRRVQQLIRRELGTENAQPSRGYGVPPTWGIGPRWYFEKRELRQFQYRNWQGEEEGAYGDHVRQQFELHLQTYLSEIRNRANTLPKTPRISKPERFEMLALYLCRGMNREQIAELPGFSKDATVIYRDIQEAARMIELPLRPRGRPQKKLQEKPFQ